MFSTMSDEFRRIWMPYLVLKINDGIGGWIPLNRYYKPIGTVPPVWVKYEDAPRGGRIKEITLPQQKKLHWAGGGANWRPNDAVWLYDDGCIPTRSAANWNDYQEKLQLLAKLDCFGG